MKRYVTFACAGLCLAMPAMADVPVVEVIEIVQPQLPSETVNALYYYDLDTLAPTVPQSLTPGAGVTITETEHRPYFYTLEGSEYLDEPYEIGGTVQYTVQNNMVGWDIVGFGVTNPAYDTFAYAAEGIDCRTVELGSCWDALAITRDDLEFARALAGEDADALFDVIDQIYGDDYVLHTYLYSLIEEVTEDEIFDDRDEFGLDAEFALEGQGLATAIMSGTSQDHFYFDYGFAASNIIGLAVNGQGQGLVFSNVQLNPTAVPVPAAGLLLIGGVAGLGLMRRKV